MHSMLKIINGLLNFIKIMMLLVCFVLSFYIIIKMYQRLNKDLVKTIFNFIPFIMLFVLFAINLIFKQKVVTQNIFYNITCVLVFSMLGFSIYRTFFDKNFVPMLLIKTW